MRTRADGALYYSYVLPPVGTATTEFLDTTGTPTWEQVVHPAGGDPNDAKDIYQYPAGQPYAADHAVYNASGVLVSEMRTHTDGSLYYS